MKCKICGISDSKTLTHLTNHSYPPQYIGFIVNYPKSKRFVECNQLKELLKINKNNSKYDRLRCEKQSNNWLLASFTPKSWRIWDIFIRHTSCAKVSNILKTLKHG